MKKGDKALMIDELKEKFANNPFFYITDSSSLTVAAINKFRRICFEKGIEVQVVKNTLVKKAMEPTAEEKNYVAIYDALHGPTTLLFCETANLPAKVIKEFRKSSDRPFIKGAYIDSGVYLGDDQIDALANLKSKEELVGEIIGLLQSPAKNVISALKSGGNTIAGLVKALEERAN
ncbi:MAG: 50S ribosomal protein L10 [Saprospiraceae bacterium]|nr:50S ribosomal protein L10 [Saprospiraceae bacterium]